MSLRIALFVLLIPPLAVAADCSHDAKSKEGLVAVENSWVAALNASDQQALGCILAPEFKDAGVHGEQRTRTKVLADLPHRRDVGQKLDELESILIGGAGVVCGVNHISTPEGKPLVDVRFTDLFAYRDGRWQAVSAQETLVRPEKQGDR